jgi:hypothetical protein
MPFDNRESSAKNVPNVQKRSHYKWEVLTRSLVLDSDLLRDAAFEVMISVSPREGAERQAFTARSPILVQNFSPSKIVTSTPFPFLAFVEKYPVPAGSEAQLRTSALHVAFAEHLGKIQSAPKRQRYSLPMCFRRARWTCPQNEPSD